MMFPFLNMVPDKPVLQPGDLLLNEACIVNAAMVNAAIMDGKPLSACITDNGLRLTIGSLRDFAQPFCSAGFHQRRCRGPRSPRPPSRNPGRCV
jgi:hypothetical protein